MGGGGALSRDVGGSGNLQQSPLQYRGSGDTVQTIEGLRLNNLCAQGAYSGVYWNDSSFEEFSYVTGADSAEMGQGGMRVNMVPSDGGNQFRGTVIGNYAGEAFGSDNCGSPGIGQPCTRSNLSGSTTFNPNNTLTNVDVIQKIWDVNPQIGGPIMQEQAVVQLHVPPPGARPRPRPTPTSTRTPRPSSTTRTSRKPGLDDGHIVEQCGPRLVAGEQQGQVLGLSRQPAQVPRPLGHRGDIPPEAAGVQVTPTSYVNVTKWTRTHTNRLLFEAGFGIYNQEYTELYQPR